MVWSHIQNKRAASQEDSYNDTLAGFSCLILLRKGATGMEYMSNHGTELYEYIYIIYIYKLSKRLAMDGFVRLAMDGLRYQNVDVTNGAYAFGKLGKLNKTLRTTNW